jgi:hypothetical protein
MMDIRTGENILCDLMPPLRDAGRRTLPGGRALCGADVISAHRLRTRHRSLWL